MANQSNFDFGKGSIILFPSGNQSGTIVSADQPNLFHRGISLLLNVTAVGATPTITVTIQGKDVVSGNYYTLLAGAAVATVSQQRLLVYPGCPATANVSANDVLPATWRVQAVCTNITATIGAALII